MTAFTDLWIRGSTTPYATVLSYQILHKPAPQELLCTEKTKEKTVWDKVGRTVAHTSIPQEAVGPASPGPDHSPQWLELL